MIGVTRQLIEHAMKTENQQFSSSARSADAKGGADSFAGKAPGGLHQCRNKPAVAEES
jgi:hypothetical protein